MVKYCTRTLSFLIGLIAAGGIAACAGAPAKQDELKAHALPVTWTQELGMASLLDQSPEVNTQKDLSELLGLPWYTSINIKAPELNKPQSVASCNEYFAVKTPELRAQKEQEYSALLELMMMCEATRLLSEASPAKQSNIPAQPLNAQLPEKLPNSIALVTSQSEWNRIKNDQGISTWGDVNAVSVAEQPSTHQIEFRSDAGLQTLSILGRGDFNEDGSEDLLLSVKDTVEGGSYFNLRLFVLTVIDQGDWQVEAAY